MEKERTEKYLKCRKFPPSKKKKKEIHNLQSVLKGICKTNNSSWYYPQ